LSHALPQHTIIVRPHPAENKESWRANTAALPNVRVIHEGAAANWILGAEAVIHNNCTTGVEAFLLDKPVFAYCPLVAKEFDYGLPNAVSYQVASVEELCRVVREQVQEPEAKLFVQEGRQKVAQHYIGSLAGPLASEKIVAALQELAVRPQVYQPSTWHLFKKRTISSLPKGIKLLKQKLRGGSGTQYLKHKFPGLVLAEVEQALARLQAVSGRFSKVQTRQLEKSVFCIYQA
jgi:hypothetical protein